MKTKKIMSIVIILCVLIISSGNVAAADKTEINENEQRVIDAAIAGYTFEGKKYVVTDSGLAALERRMRKTDLNEKDANNLINSKLTAYDIQEQLQKGYITLATDGSSNGSLPYSPTDAPENPDSDRNTDPSEPDSETNDTGTDSTGITDETNTDGTGDTKTDTDGTGDTKTDTDGTGTTNTDTESADSKKGNSKTNDTSDGSDKVESDETDEGKASDTTAASGNPKGSGSDSEKTGSSSDSKQQSKSGSNSNESAASGKVASASSAKTGAKISNEETVSYRSSESKASSIWDAIVSDFSEGKTGSFGSDSSSKDSDSSSKNSSLDTDSKTSLLEETLSLFDSENKQESKLSSYKMVSKDKADIKILCSADSEEMEILDKDGDTVLSFSDSDVKSNGVEGNIIHIEWMIPLFFVLLFISVVLGYVTFRQSDYMKSKKSESFNKDGRIILSVVSTVIMIVCILTGLFTTGLAAGLFRSSTALQAVNNSSYYEYAYAQMAENTVRILEENNIDPLTLTEVLDYDNFTLVVKQQIERQLSTPKDSFSVEKTQNNVSEKLEEYYKTAEAKELEEKKTQETKDQKKQRQMERKTKVNAITNSIMTNYKKYAEFYLAHFIRQVKRDVRAVLQIVFPIAALTGLVNLFTLYCLNQRRKYATINYMGGALAVSALATLAGFAILFAKKPYANLYLSPEYLYQFILSYFNQGAKTFCIISGFFVILAILLLILNRILFFKKR